MLDKTAYKVLNNIAFLTDDMENLVVKKSDIIDGTELKISFEELDRIIELLEVNDMISLLYSDAKMYCVTVRPKGKLMAERHRNENVAVVQVPKEEAEDIQENYEEIPQIIVEGQPPIVSNKKMYFLCGICSFFGALVGGLISILIMLVK